MSTDAAKGVTMIFRIRGHTSILAAVATSFIGLALAEGASAVDLRDWGRKFPTSERFVVLAQFNNQAVLDKETQLVWQRTPSGISPWQEAIDECFHLKLGSRLGWRLPTVPELLSLIQANAPDGMLRLPTGHPFKNVEGPLYWTANLPRNPSGEPAADAYAVSFFFSGPVFKTPLQQARNRWCVRGGGDLPE